MQFFDNFLLFEGDKNQVLKHFCDFYHYKLQSYDNKKLNKFKDLIVILLILRKSLKFQGLLMKVEHDT